MSYKELKSYQSAVIIYDFTVEFCDRYVDKKSRTHDQMVQAARSGKQNIVEGSSNKTSEKNELFLLGVARASFSELLEDYEDFLRQRKLGQWGKEDAKALEVRRLVYKSDGSDGSDGSDKSDRTYESYSTYLLDPEQAANAAVCLISQASYLLDQQIRAAESQFAKTGDYSDKLKNQKFRSRLKQEQDAEKWAREQFEKYRQDKPDRSE